MTITFVLLILFAVITLGLLFLRGGIPVGNLDEAEISGQLQPVDLEAFRNLTDPEEEEFLRCSLSRGEFRAIERQRLRAAIDYLIGVFHNAALLLHAGQAAGRSSDPRVAEAGRNLVANAFQLRIFSVLAICKLSARIALPGTVLQPAGIVDRYQEMKDRAIQLGRLQYPGRGGLLYRTL